MKSDLAWTYMIAILSVEFQEQLGPGASERAADTALFFAQNAGLVSKTPRIHLAAKAK